MKEFISLVKHSYEHDMGTFGFFVIAVVMSITLTSITIYQLLN